MDLFAQVANKIPDVEQLLALEPEELAARILLLWQSYSPNEFAEPNTFDPTRRMNSYDVPYPADRWPEVGLAFSEAFFLVNSSGPSGAFKRTTALFTIEQTRAQSQNRIGFCQLQDRTPPSP